MSNEKLSLFPSTASVQIGEIVTVTAQVVRNGMSISAEEFILDWQLPKESKFEIKHKDDKLGSITFDTSNCSPGVFSISAKLQQSITEKDAKTAKIVDLDSAMCVVTVAKVVNALNVSSLPPIDITTKRYRTETQPLHVAIRARTNAISFSQYLEFLNIISSTIADLGQEAQKTITGALSSTKLTIGTNTVCEKTVEQFMFRNAYAYDFLKIATQIFLILNNCQLQIKENDYDETSEESRLGRRVSLSAIQRELENYLGPRHRLPYFDTILENLSLSGYLNNIFSRENKPLRSRVECPCMIELIWSYWHEEGLLVQTLNAISMRYQNRKTSALRDPLAQFTLDPLRPMNNILWGYIQDEHNRLSLQRRAYEYDHEYGLSLIGKAVPELQSADSRSKFLEAFHLLLNTCMNFFKEENNKMVVPDPFPLLNALREVHLLLAEGAHNQFGELPWTARIEMLMQQWLLAQPQMREFLGRRPMMPYNEAWMPAVDSMKALQGWSDVSIMHFRDLGVFGEQIVLSIRYGNWNEVNDAEEARNWALYWRNEIQSYIHAYRAVTGVDLANPVTKGFIDFVKPSVHLSRRLELQRQGR